MLRRQTTFHLHNDLIKIYYEFTARGSGLLILFLSHFFPVSIFSVQKSVFEKF